MRRFVLFGVVLVFAALLLTGCASNGADDPESNAAKGQAEGSEGQGGSGVAADEWEVTLLDGHPEDAVPFYESNLLDTEYFSVRNDPQWAAVEGGLRNFYHTVYQTDADISDVLDFYRELMDTVDESKTVDNQIEGTVGPYTLWVNTTEQGSYNAVYMRIDLPKSEVTEVNPFFADYPTDLVETPECFAFFEEIFYRTLYRETDMSYTRHFDIVDLDGDGAVDLDADERYAYFEERYADKEEFTVDREAGMVKWLDGEYHVTVAYMDGYERGVLIVGMDYKP